MTTAAKAIDSPRIKTIRQTIVRARRDCEEALVGANKAERRFLRKSIAMLNRLPSLYIELYAAVDRLFELSKWERRRRAARAARTDRQNWQHARARSMSTTNAATDAPAPPKFIEPTFCRMPAEMKLWKNWVLWAAVWNGSKWTKRPIQISGYGAIPDESSLSGLAEMMSGSGSSAAPPAKRNST